MPLIIEIYLIPNLLGILAGRNFFFLLVGAVFFNDKNLPKGRVERPPNTVCIVPAFVRVRVT
jgi:hypothetical protein